MKNILICLCFIALNVVQAGGGPEAVIVVVNNDNADSKEIANYYCALRKIPDLNIIYLSDVPAANTITLDEFRGKILQPILQQIQQRGLQSQVDYITYSCGFPTRVTFSNESTKKFSWVRTPHASITGLTYLFQMSLKSEDLFLNPKSNLYYRRTSFEAAEQEDIQKPSEEELKDVYAFFKEKGQRDGKRRKEKTKKTDKDKAWEANGWQQAQTTLAALAEQYPDDTGTLYNLACAQAMTGAADAAMQTLQHCVAKGYTNWPHMRSDNDLKSLRQREDFKAMITTLKETPINVADSLGFRTVYGFDTSGAVVAADKGVHYIISTMLGYTGERGNSVEEIKAYLRTAAAADYSQPQGTFYFPVNGDVRSTTREWGVYSCAEQLKAAGFQADVSRGTIPKNADKVIGAHVGIATFDWEASGSTMLPGAIAEHLTSWGAEFDRNGQTKISAWLRAGVAGTSGTVSEPLALQFKFPTPFLYLHYARGSSLGEAFYQSVSGPYHLLILGDALCQPFAQAGSMTVSGLPEQGIVTEACTVSVKTDKDIAGYFVFINGRSVGSYASGVDMQLDPAKATPGYYDLRIVALDKTPLQTRTAQQQLLRFGALDPKLSCTASETDGGIEVRYSCERIDGFSRIALMHNARMLASSDATSGTLHVDRSESGKGPVRLRPVLLNAEKQLIYLGKPLEIGY